VGRLALALAAFAAPATAPEEDVALLLGGGGGGAGSLVAALGRAAPPSAAALAAVAAAVAALAQRRLAWRAARTAALGAVSTSRAARHVILGADFPAAARVERAAAHVHVIAAQRGRHLDFAEALRQAVKLPERRAQEMDALLRAFVFVIPRARAPPPALWCSHPEASAVAAAAAATRTLQAAVAARGALLHVPRLRTQLFFPDRRLLQYDCGKLQELAALLARLRLGAHRALIFTQMSKMLDILEAFLNLHGYTYVRLDGSTKPEQRQALMQRFNSDPRIFCFILSTRSGGVGMNLTGADTVVFYDSDWNPAMDAQVRRCCWDCCWG
jgi:E1A-binding protein p400